jgi:heme exporter protein C
MRNVVSLIFKLFLGVWMSGVIWAAFMYAPRAKALGETTRVLFFHVPCAWIGTLAFLVSAVYSVKYLRSGALKDDVWSASSAHLGFIFTILATITGAIWANEIWGHPWNWDPRQTSIFILLLIYGAYFALRSAIEDPEKRARLSSVYSIIAFLTVPFFMYIVPRIYDSLHPDPLINSEGKIKMNTQMRQVFFASLFGFTLLYIWLLRLKTKISILEAKFQTNRLTTEKQV